MPRDPGGAGLDEVGGQHGTQLHAIYSEVYKPGPDSSRIFQGIAAECLELDISVGPEPAGCPACRLARAILEEHPELADALIVPGWMRAGVFMPSFNPAPVGTWAELTVSEGGRSAHFVKYRTSKPCQECASGGSTAPRRGSASRRRR